jgi:hypothetical protein
MTEHRRTVGHQFYRFNARDKLFPRDRRRKQEEMDLGRECDYSLHSKTDEVLHTLLPFEMVIQFGLLCRVRTQSIQQGVERLLLMILEGRATIFVQNGGSLLEILRELATGSHCRCIIILKSARVRSAHILCHHLW